MFIAFTKKENADLCDQSVHQYKSNTFAYPAFISVSVLIDVFSDAPLAITSVEFIATETPFLSSSPSPSVIAIKFHVFPPKFSYVYET